MVWTFLSLAREIEDNTRNIKETRRKAKQNNNAENQRKINEHYTIAKGP